MQRKILSYCVLHPDAKDSIDGILHWWGVGGSARRSEVAEVLEALTARGWLNRRSAGQSGTLYSVNKSQLPSIEKYLDAGGGPQEP